MARHFGMMLIICAILVGLCAAAHAENAASGYKNVVSKSYFIPAMVIPGYDTWGQSAGWLPAMNGSHPKPRNRTLDDKDKADPANIPGVYQMRSREIVIFSSKRRK